jgi:multicomponent Na+:H+ antiporter subunit D
MLVLPLISVGLTVLFDRRANLRDIQQMLIGTALFCVAIRLAGKVFEGARPEITFWEVIPGFPLRLRVEPLGMLFALVASGLWVLTTVYSVGYMRAHHERHQTRFYACFGIAIFATVGAALSSNLLSLFIFYELLTLSTYPLVTHHGTDEARRGGRTYLAVLICSSIAFLLLAIGLTWAVAGTIEFTPGGVLAGAWREQRISRWGLGGLLALFAFGSAKAALMPLHRWLPAAMVAPTPVSALLHAVAVVKVGVFTVLKTIVYIFGIDLLQTTGISTWLMYVASASVLIASLVAMTKDNLKARLAYSTVSQLSYITLGAALAQPASVVGAGMHIAMHALAKITLFFCAGAIYVTTHKTEISQMRGLGRRMPLTMTAFLLGSLSIIGLPPFGGLWSKWFLAQGAAAAHQPLLVGVLMVSSLLNVAYLVPVAAAGFYLPARSAHQSGDARGIQEAPLMCLVPLCLTALGGIALFFFAEQIHQVLLPLGALP